MLGLGHYLFREANSFSEENCQLRGTDNVRGQISQHIFAPNGGYRIYYPPNLFRNALILKIGECKNDSLHLARKYARIFVRGHYLFGVANR